MKQGSTFDDLNTLDVALTGVFDTSTSTVNTETAILRTDMLVVLRNRTDAAVIDALYLAHQRALEVKAPRPGTTVAAHVHCDPGDMRAALKWGKWLRDFPVVHNAFRDGVVSVRHLAELKRVDSIRTHRQMIDDQDLLVGFVERLDFIDFRQAIEYWKNAADADGEEPKDTVADTRLSFRKQGDGSVKGNFYLDPIAAQVLMSTVAALSQRLLSQQRESEDGAVASVGARNAQALLLLLIAGAQSNTHTPVKPFINLVVGAELAKNLIDRTVDPLIEPIEPSATDVNRRCEFLDGTPVHPLHAAMLLAIGTIQRVSIDDRGKVIDRSYRSRCFPAEVKELLLLQARGRCSKPGCDAPLPWLHADHVMPYSKDGPTRLGNGQILCGPHNLAKRDTEET